MRWRRVLSSEREAPPADRLSLATGPVAHAADQWTWVQCEALLQLRVLTGDRAPLAGYRGFALSPDAALWLALCIMHNRPATVVELGSGVSTAVIAAAAASAGIPSRIISVDHDEDYAAQTRSLLDARGLDADVRHAPLLALDGWPQRWYDPAVFDDVDGAELLVVDGPPDVAQLGTRAPAVPVLRGLDVLAPDAVIVVDDADRPREVEMIEQWRADDPALHARGLRAEKGLTALSRDRDALALSIPPDL